MIGGDVYLETSDRLIQVLNLHYSCVVNKSIEVDFIFKAVGRDFGGSYI